MFINFYPALGRLCSSDNMTHGFVWTIINMLGVLFHSVEVMKEINKCQLPQTIEKSLFLSAYFLNDAIFAPLECNIYTDGNVNTVNYQRLKI